MNKIEINKEIFYPCRVRNYGIYEKKLRHILRRNQNEITFIGCMSEDGKVGIIAMGEDTQRINTFNKFFGLREINKYFYTNLGD